MKPELDLLGAVSDERARVRAHPAWGSGPERIYDLLRTATRLRAMEITAGVTSDLTWESVLAQLVVWHHEFPVGKGPCSEVHATEVTALAAAAHHLDLLETGIRTGAYQVRPTGGGFRVRHSWDASVEVADALLAAAAVPSQLPKLSETERRWIATRSGSSRTGPPPEVLRAAVDRASETIEAYRKAVPEGQVPDTFPLGEGMTAGDMTAVLSVIMGIASLCEQTAHRLSRLETTLAHMQLSQLMVVLTEMCPTVPETHLALAVERLTYSIGRSCRTSPLVRHGETVIICPPLVTPRAVDPFMLRSAAHDSRQFGRIGREQGDRATAWTEWLRTTPGAMVAERVPATRADGRSAGDLDVVVVDPARRVGLCLEIKWPIEAISLPEALKVENWVSSAARQLDRLRAELRAGAATAQLPEGWPSFEAIDWTWCVGTPQQLCLRPLPAPEMHATSLRYVQALGPPPDLSTLVGALVRPDLPTQGVHYEVTRRSFPVAHRQVHLDVLGVTVGRWRPRFR
ncbi:hypothetical protein AB0399_22335 [Streptomyces sp. NPDC088194]|uniref:hypothetical protein n=1 Tax=Streptomyces sp. NPDC088194 TaxID=3154931 RepID=UPI00344D1493